MVKTKKSQIVKKKNFIKIYSSLFTVITRTIFLIVSPKASRKKSISLIFNFLFNKSVVKLEMNRSKRKNFGLNVNKRLAVFFAFFVTFFQRRYRRRPDHEPHDGRAKLYRRGYPGNVADGHACFSAVY